MFGEFGKLTRRILSSTAGLSAVALMVLVASVLSTRPKSKLLSVGGILLAGLSGTLLLLLIWCFDHDSDNFAKATITVWLLSIGTTHFSLLRLPRLRPSWGWLQSASGVLIYLFHSVIIHGIWTSEHSESATRLLGIFGILVATLSVGIPTAYWLTKGAPQVPTSQRPSIIAMLCPVCRREQDHPLGIVTCVNCGSRFEVLVIDRKDSQQEG